MTKTKENESESVRDKREILKLNKKHESTSEFFFLLYIKHFWFLANITKNY